MAQRCLECCLAGWHPGCYIEPRPSGRSVQAPTTTKAGIMRRSNVLVAGLVLVLVGAGTVTGARMAGKPAHVPAQGGAMVTSRDVLSCKPLPPVTVSLAKREDGTWQVDVTALETTPAVRVEIGTGDRGRSLWSGALRAGELRRFEARMESGALDTWATAEVASPAGTTLRSVAIVPGTGSRTRTLTAAETGRIVVDPKTGDGVFEYRGQMEAAR